MPLQRKANLFLLCLLILPAGKALPESQPKSQKWHCHWWPMLGYYTGANVTLGSGVPAGSTFQVVKGPHQGETLKCTKCQFNEYDFPMKRIISNFPHTHPGWKHLDSAEAYHGWIYSSQTCPMGCSEPKPECPACCQDGEWVPKTEFGQCNLPRANGNNEYVCKKNPFDGYYDWVPETNKPGDPCSIPTKYDFVLGGAPDKYGFNKPCVSHDQCYGACTGGDRIGKALCDGLFRGYMLVSCSKFEDLEKKDACIYYADLIYQGVKIGGDKSFRERRRCCKKDPPQCFVNK